MTYKPRMAQIQSVDDGSGAYAIEMFEVLDYETVGTRSVACNSLSEALKRIAALMGNPNVTIMVGDPEEREARDDPH